MIDTTTRTPCPFCGRLSRSRMQRDQRNNIAIARHPNQIGDAMMSAKSRQAYAISMRNAYWSAPVVEVFFHAGSAILPSQRGWTWHRRGWYWRDCEIGEFAGPFDSAVQAESDFFGDAAK